MFCGTPEYSQCFGPLNYFLKHQLNALWLWKAIPFPRPVYSCQYLPHNDSPEHQKSSQKDSLSPMAVLVHSESA